MTLTRNVNGKRIVMSEQAETSIRADWAKRSAPKSQTEIEAEIDAATDAEKSKGERADRLMLFRVLKAADPAYTKAQFRIDRRKLIAAMS